MDLRQKSDRPAAGAVPLQGGLGMRRLGSGRVAATGRWVSANGLLSYLYSK